MIAAVVAILVEMLCSGALKWGGLSKAIIIRERI